MNRTLWIWQFDALFDAWGHAPIAPIISNLGFNRVAIKALDGVDWMSRFDTSTDAISGLDAVSSWEKSFAEHGLLMDVWVVPRLEQLGDQQALWNKLVPYQGRLIFDLEPYSGFWGPSTCEPLVNYIRAMHSAVSFDARRLDWPGIGACLDAASVQMPQLYSAEWLGGAIASEGGHSCPVEPILSTEQPASEWLSILRDSRLGSLRGRTGFGIFGAPVIGTEYAGALRGMA